MSMSELLADEKRRTAELERQVSQLQDKIDQFTAAAKRFSVRPDTDWSDDAPAPMPAAVRYMGERLTQDPDGALVRYADYQQLKTAFDSLQQDHSELQSQHDALQTCLFKSKQEAEQLRDLVFSDDTCSYLGFTPTVMLNHLSKISERVEVCAVGEYEWRLSVTSDVLGEYENTGTLMATLGQACKPYLKQWALERKEFAKKFRIQEVAL